MSTRREKLENRVKLLGLDYKDVTGEIFEHFFCPITYRDVPVELCQAHIENQASENRIGTWTVQNREVDAFFGSFFEADQIELQRFRTASVGDVLENPNRFRKARPVIAHDGKEVYYYRPAPKATVPPEHSVISIDGDPDRLVCYKMSPKDLGRLVDAGTQPEILVDAEYRIPTLVTALKTAHLTLIHLLGYRYVLSYSGQYLGREILGTFFEQNKGKGRQQIAEAAEKFFPDYSTLARPLVKNDLNLAGSIRDKKFLVCWSGSDRPRGLQVLVNLGGDILAVLCPSGGGMEPYKTFFDFLESSNEDIRVRLARLSSEEERFEVDPNSIDVRWTKQGAWAPP